MDYRDEFIKVYLNLGLFFIIVSISFFVVFRSCSKEQIEVINTVQDTLYIKVDSSNKAALNLTYQVDSLSEVITNQVELIEYYKEKHNIEIDNIDSKYEKAKDSVLHIIPADTLVNELRAKVRKY